MSMPHALRRAAQGVGGESPSIAFMIFDLIKSHFFSEEKRAFYPKELPAPGCLVPLLARR